MTTDRDYVLATGDDEIARLGLQHRVWRDHAIQGWRRAGFAADHTLVDVGCGPGYATLDLADVVGPNGRVIALDKSKRFLDVLGAAARQRGLTNIARHEVDLGAATLPNTQADGAWCRWILAFVERPRTLLAELAGSLRPQCTLVIHEYFDYGAWRALPGCPEVDEFVGAVIRSWRSAGGEPDVGLSLPQWLVELGFRVSIRPIVDIVPPAHPMWTWMRAFIETGRRRLTESGHLAPGRADAIWSALTAVERIPSSLMVTPGVIEIVAVRR